MAKDQPSRLKEQIVAELKAENWQAALALLEGWCDRFPTDARAWVNRGYCLMRLERFPAALEALDRSLRLDAGMEKAVELRRHVEGRLQAPQSATVASMGPRRTEQAGPRKPANGPAVTQDRHVTATATSRWRSTRQATFATFGTRPTTEAERIWRERTVVAGRYDVLEALRGGMGVVYIAFDRELQRVVAVKTPLPSVLASEDGRARFHREAEAWIALGGHPNICTALYVQEIGGMPRLFIEYVDGGDLDGVLRDKPELPAADRLDIAIQIASGMDYTHSFEWTDDDGVEHLGLVHRDLKPANVMMTRDGVAQVTDFGLVRSKLAADALRVEGPLDLAIQPDARIVVDESLSGGSWQTVTQAGGVLGTPPYLAPELWKMSGRATVASDMYAFGCVLYEIFCRRRPFAVARRGAPADPGGQLAEWMQLHNSEPPPDPVAWSPGLDRGLAAVMIACLAKSPDGRPGSFASVRDQLVGVYEQITGGTYPRPEPQRARLLADSLNNRAVSYVTLGKAGRGSTGLREALEVDPNHLEATYNRCLTEWRNRGLTDAEMVRRLEEVGRNAANPYRAHHLLGRLHLMLDNPLAALDELRAAAADGEPPLDLRRDTGFALLAAARIGGGRGLYVEAERELAAVLDASENELAPLLGRAESQQALGQRELSAETWRSAREQAPDLPDELDRAVALMLPWHKPEFEIRLPDQIQWTALLGDDRIACRDKAGAVTVLDLHTKKVVAALKTKEAARRGRSIAPVPGTQWAAISLSNQPIGIWDLATGDRVHGFRTHPGQPTCVEVTPDGLVLVTGGSDRRVRLWDTATGECRRALEGHETFVTDVAVDSTGQRILSASSDSTLRMWAAADGACTRVLTGHHGAVNVVRWLPEEGLAVSGGADGTVRVWDVESGRLLRTLVGHGQEVTAVEVLGGDTGIVVSGSDDRTLRVWDLDTGSPLRVVRVGQGVSDLKIPPDGTTVLVAQGSTLAAYDLPHDLAVRLPLALTEPVETIELEAREERFLQLLREAQTAIDSGDHAAAMQPLREAREVEGYSQSAEVLDLWGRVLAHFPKGRLRGHAELREFDGHEGAITGVAFTPDSRFGASTGADGTIKVWELATGRQQGTIEAHDGPVAAVAVSPDGRQVLSADRAGTIRVWLLSTGECLREMTAGVDAVTSLAFCPDGYSVVTGGENGKVLMWHLDDPSPAELIGEHREPVSAVAVSDDGRFVVSGGWDRDIVVWSVRRRTELQRFAGSEGAITAVAVSPDCRWVASAGEDGVIRLWDRTAERCWRMLPGHEGPVLSIAVSPDARFLVSGGRDATLRLWNLRTGRCSQVVEGHTGPVSAVEFNRDGRYLLSGGADASLRHWYLDWEPEVPEGVGWDDRVRPFLEVFLRLRYDGTPVGGRPSWTDAQFDELRSDLARRGFGWVDGHRVLRELEALTSNWDEQRGREQRAVEQLAQRQQRRHLLEPIKDAVDALSQNLSYRLIAAVLVVITVPLAIMSLRAPKSGEAKFNRTLFHQVDLAFQERSTRLSKGTALAYQGKRRTMRVDGGSGGCTNSSFPDYLDIALRPDRHSQIRYDPGMMATDEVFRIRYQQAIVCLGELGGGRAVQPILSKVQADLHPLRVEDLLSVLVRAGDASRADAIDALSSVSAPTRRIAAMSLAYANEPGALEPLVQALAGGDLRSLEAASYVLTELILVGAVADAEAFSTVRRMAQSIDPRVRRNAIRALILFERAGPMQGLLEEALQDPDRGVALTARNVDESLRAAVVQKYFGVNVGL